MNGYELIEKQPSWVNSNFYDEYDKERFEILYKKNYEQPSVNTQKLNKYSDVHLHDNYVEQRTTTEKWRKYEDNNSQIIQMPREFHRSYNSFHNTNFCAVDSQNFRNISISENPGLDEEPKKFSYCYLCSIKGHVHTKTEPVPISKRRYLRPYMNPLLLMKKYEENQVNATTKVKYTIFVKTGSGQFAGTDATVFFKLFGSSGNWGQTELKPLNPGKGVKFPAESLVEIELDGPIVGELRKLKIWHTGKTIKEGWYLEHVEVVCPKLKQSSKFLCDRWLSNHRAPEFKTTAILLSNDQIVTPEQLNQNTADYIIIIKTSDRSIPLGDFNVQFQFVCSKGQSIIFNLISPYVTLFDQFQLDSFLVNSSIDLGKPEKLRMAIEHGGKTIPADWTIEEFKVIYSKEPNKFYTFKLDRWIEKNGKLNAAITPGPTVAIDSNEDGDLGKMIYHVTVITGSSKLAGTDAHVFIEIAGELGNTSIHRLYNPKAKREFERNQTDHFHLFDNNIGQIKAIRIFHDNSGVAPGWLLDTVLIKCVSTHITGKKEKQDPELRDQLFRLKKKLRIRELKLNMSEVSGRSRTHKPRSSSADSAKSNDTKDLPKRSTSANSAIEPKITTKDQLSSQSPTSSILKTAASPRNQRKTVKFNSKDFYHQISDDGSKKSTSVSSSGGQATTKTKLDMKLSWLMSVVYNEQNQIKSLRTIENFDRGLKNIDDRHIAKYDLIFKEQEVKLTKGKKNEEKVLSPEKLQSPRTKNTDEKNNNLMYVFECKKWLAKDSPDKKIERIVKVTNILNC